MNVCIGVGEQLLKGGVPFRVPNFLPVESLFQLLFIFCLTARAEYVLKLVYRLFPLKRQHLDMSELYPSQQFKNSIQMYRQCCQSEEQQLCALLSVQLVI